MNRHAIAYWLVIVGILALAFAMLCGIAGAQEPATSADATPSTFSKLRAQYAGDPDALWAIEEARRAYVAMLPGPGQPEAAYRLDYAAMERRCIKEAFERRGLPLNGAAPAAPFAAARSQWTARITPVTHVQQCQSGGGAMPSVPMASPSQRPDFDDWKAAPRPKLPVTDPPEDSSSASDSPTEPPVPDYDELAARLDAIQQQLAAMAPIPGPPGDRGPQGERGPQGPPGPACDVTELTARIDALSVRVDAMQPLSRTEVEAMIAAAVKIPEADLDEKIEEAIRNKLDVSVEFVKPK